MIESLAPRTYRVITYGCQMNVHDSERISGLLEDAGYVAPPGDEADVVVFNTCAVRENADNRLYGNLGHLAPAKAAHVLKTTTYASSPGGATYPASSSSPEMRSESWTFIWQPYVMTRYVRGARDSIMARPL